MLLEEALLLFRRLGVDVEALGPDEFTEAYHRLAQRYHPDISPRSAKLMANINVARALILKSYRPLLVLLCLVAWSVAWPAS